MPKKRLVGFNATMSLVNNKTGDLWRSFLERENEVGNRIGKNRYSLQIYDENYFKNFSPNNEFVKWACVEVADFSSLPKGMFSLEVPDGLYAIFLHKGASMNAQKTFQNIFGSWLPTSGYALDSKPHFEILGERYRNNDPSSEEDICIPIKE